MASGTAAGAPLAEVYAILIAAGRRAAEDAAAADLADMPRPGPDPLATVQPGPESGVR